MSPRRRRPPLTRTALQLPPRAPSGYSACFSRLYPGRRAPPVRPLRHPHPAAATTSASPTAPFAWPRGADLLPTRRPSGLAAPSRGAAAARRPLMAPPAASTPARRRLTDVTWSGPLPAVPHRPVRPRCEPSPRLGHLRRSPARRAPRRTSAWPPARSTRAPRLSPSGGHRSSAASGAVGGRRTSNDPSARPVARRVKIGWRRPRCPALRMPGCIAPRSHCTLPAGQHLLARVGAPALLHHWHPDQTDPIGPAAASGNLPPPSATTRLPARPARSRRQSARPFESDLSRTRAAARRHQLAAVEITATRVGAPPRSGRGRCSQHASCPSPALRRSRTVWPARTSSPSVAVPASPRLPIITALTAAVGPRPYHLLGRLRHRRTGHDPDGGAGLQPHPLGVPGGQVRGDRQTDRPLLRGVGDVGREHRVPVHRRVVEQRQVQQRDHVLRQNAVQAVRQRQLGGRRRPREGECRPQVSWTDFTSGVTDRPAVLPPAGRRRTRASSCSGGLGLGSRGHRNQALVVHRPVVLPATAEPTPIRPPAGSSLWAAPAARLLDLAPATAASAPTRTPRVQHYRRSPPVARGPAVRFPPIPVIRTTSAASSLDRRSRTGSPSAVRPSSTTLAPVPRWTSIIARATISPSRMSSPGSTPPRVPPRARRRTARLPPRSGHPSW